MRSSVDLPEPDPAEQADDFARTQVQVDVVQYNEIAGAVLVVGLLAVADFQEGSHRKAPVKKQFFFEKKNQKTFTY